MIGYQLQQYPDEIMFSHLVRYIRNTLRTNYVDTSLELFGIPNAKLSIDLPTRLNYLFESTYKFIEPDPQSLINKYTLLPVYFPFLTHVKREYAQQIMMNGPGTGLHAKLGITAGSSNATTYPKFCPQCLIENKKDFGEAYYHRAHQIPDSFVCPLHNQFIQEYKPILEYTGYAKILDPSNIQINKVKIIENTNSMLLSICKDFNEILNGNNTFDINTINYHEQLIKSNFSRGSQLQWDKIESGFEKFFGKELLKQILKQPISVWIKGIVHRPQTYFHPLRHILVNKFLETLSFKTDLFNNSFPDGPWQCVNRSAEHYGKNVVHDITIKYSNRDKTRVAIAKCSCGMVYKVKFKSAGGKLIEVKRITKYGDVWTNAVSQELGQGKSIRSVAAKFDTSHSVIKRWVVDSNRVDLRKHGSGFAETLKKKKKQYLNLLKNDSDSRVSFAKKQNKKLYSWLYHNAPEWMMSVNSKYRSKSYEKKKRKDWQLIDNEVSEQLSFFSEKIREEKFEGMVSKNLLSKVAGHVKYLSPLNAVKLPKTQKLLDSLVESEITYQLKRANNTIKELMDSEEKITLYKVMRKAGIKAGGALTKDRIGKLIEKHCA